MAAQGPDKAPMQFQPLRSCVGVAFWHTFSQKKLEDFKLNTNPVDLTASFGPAPPAPSRSTSKAGIPSRLLLGENAFDCDQEHKRLLKDQYPMKGKILNVNTVEAFKALDKRKLLDAEGEALWKDIESGACTRKPSMLNRFLLLSFANLKTHRYYYWFAFTALSPGPKQPAFCAATPPRRIGSCLSNEAITQIFRGLASRTTPPTHFVIQFAGGGNDEKLEVLDLESFRERAAQGGGRRLFGFVDPGSLEGHLGWPARNFLMYLRFAFPRLERIELLSLRDRLADAQLDRKELKSMTLVVEMKGSEASSDQQSESHQSAKFITTGWELNTKGRAGARVVDLRSVFDPKTLAESSANLNLKLMRWRSLPSLDTVMLKGSKCLLLGSGTLGCNVARTLIGWGIRHVTFVDNGKVSYSNPVRQPLFTYQDSVGGKTDKATAAAMNLKKVCPSAKASGHVLTIPMPGHTVPKSQVTKVKGEMLKLNELITSHDVIFLLTDSRESRWLPSLLAAVNRKLLINVALGFDTYVVMRHGLRDAKTSEFSKPTGGSEKEKEEKEVASTPEEEAKQQRASPQPQPQPHRLGCYFCNDVVAPTDSLTDRSLDQQCTVTRPGSAPIASAMAVELAIALLHHRAAGGDTECADAEGELGSIPHQLRGSLRRFDLLRITGNAYARCTACSDVVVRLYRERGWDFVFDALNMPAYLEEVTGLAKMKADAEALDVDFEWDDESDEEE